MSGHILASLERNTQNRENNTRYSDDMPLAPRTSIWNSYVCIFTFPNLQYSPARRQSRWGQSCCAPPPWACPPSWSASSRPLSLSFSLSLSLSMSWSFTIILQSFKLYDFLKKNHCQLNEIAAMASFILTSNHFLPHNFPTHFSSPATEFFFMLKVVRKEVIANWKIS